MIGMILEDVLSQISKIFLHLLILLLVMNYWICFIALFPMKTIRCYVLFQQNLKIFGALASLGTNKAPGLDGFTTLFFYEILGLYQTDCSTGCLEFFQEQSHA